MIVAVPDANQTFRELTFKVVSTRAESEVRPRVFFEDFPNLVLYVREVTPGARVERRAGRRHERRGRPDRLSRPPRPDAARRGETHGPDGARGWHDAQRRAAAAGQVPGDPVPPDDPGAGPGDRVPARGPPQGRPRDDDRRTERPDRRPGTPGTLRRATRSWRSTRSSRFRSRVWCSPHRPRPRRDDPARRQAGQLRARGRRRLRVLRADVPGPVAGQGRPRARLAGDVASRTSSSEPMAWRSWSAGRSRRIVRSGSPCPSRSAALPRPARGPAAGDPRAGQRTGTRVVVVIRVPQWSVPRPRILDWYVTRMYLRIVLLAGVSLLGLFYISTFIDLSDKLFRGTATGGMILHYLWFATPQFAYYVIPIAVLIGTLVTIGVLTQEQRDRGHEGVRRQPLPRLAAAPARGRGRQPDAAGAGGARAGVRQPAGGGPQPGHPGPAAAHLRRAEPPVDRRPATATSTTTSTSTRRTAS